MFGGNERNNRNDKILHIIISYLTSYVFPSQKYNTYKILPLSDFIRLIVRFPISIIWTMFSFITGILIIYLCIFEILAPINRENYTEEIIQITPGMGVSEIGKLLKEKGLIKDAFVFQAVSLIKGDYNSLKAGNYAISSNMDLLQILKRISSGDGVFYRFTIPEGFTKLEIAKLWEEKGLGNASDFTKELSDPLIAKKYGITAESLEGYLFPDTYIFSYGISEREAILMMLDQFFKKVPGVIDKSLSSLPMHEIITLASIIEKEAKVEEERPLISAVFHNRLRLDQKLESCATVLYGLGYPHRELNYNDLRDPTSRYNTYVYKGLPPGPICNPGLSSIIAAVNPSKENYLYFVSKNDGTHYFTEDYNDFIRAKKKYRG
ncbi:MAG: endolytic transglycosylase MltG [bacterium]